MKVLICCSGLFGGADLLLNRYYEWLKQNSIEVEKVALSKGIVCQKESEHFDIVILPSSQMHDLLQLKKMGYDFSRILIWIMGMGAFRDTYYNPERNHGVEKIVNKFLEKDSNKLLRLLYEKGSICFTDAVGMDNTFLGTAIHYEKNIDENMVPIGISVPKSNTWGKDTNKKEIRICWIGRVSSDFKLIPILHLIEDIADYSKYPAIDISLTIVGSGDALEKVRAIANEKGIDAQFIEGIPYEQIGEFLKENADILVAMGTSALDGAKNGCPTVVITPVRPSDEEVVDYRWIFESKGYSLGEYPGIKAGPVQEKKTFSQIIQEYVKDDTISEKSYQYALNFDEEVVFYKLYNRKQPGEVTKAMWRHIHFFALLKKAKECVKAIRKKA